MARIRISDMTAGSLPIAGTSLLETSVVNGAAPSGYDTRKYTVANLLSLTGQVQNGGTGATNLPDTTVFGVDGTLLLGHGTSPVTSTAWSQGVIGAWQQGQLACIGTATAEGGIDLARSLGTIAAPSALQQNDYFGSIWFDGYGASAWSTSSRAQISAVTSENWTNTAQGSYLVFWTTLNGTTLTNTSMSIDAWGGVEVGAPPSLGYGPYFVLSRLYPTGLPTSGADLGGLLMQVIPSATLYGIPSLDGGASVAAQAVENWTATARGTRISFSTTTVGQTSFHTAGYFDHNSDLYVSANAYKPGGGSWTATSDRELKTDDSRPYEAGLDQVLMLEPVVYRYNGRMGLPTDREYVGLVAQDAQQAMPELVERVAMSCLGNKSQRERAKARGVEDLPELIEDERGEFLTVDPSALTYALINACKTLAARLAAVEARVTSQGLTR